MSDETSSQHTTDRIAPWVILIPVVAAIVAFSWESFIGVLRILTNPVFLRGFGTVLFIAALTAILAGGLGVAIGHLIQFSDLLVRCVIRLLRRGMWLPFFLSWGLPIWRISGDKEYIVVWMNTVAVGIFAAAPTVLLAACYYYLDNCAHLKPEKSQVRLCLVRKIFLLALLISILWQMFFPRAWPWGWLVTALSANYATIIAIMTAVLLCNLACKWTLYGTAELRRVKLLHRFQFNDFKSLGQGLLIVIAGLLLWQVFSQIVKNRFSIEPPAEVGNAAFRLLVAGAGAILKSKPTLWNDIRVSLVEIGGGILFATVLAFPTVVLLSKICSPKPSGGLLSLTCIAPVGLATQIIAWVGIGVWQKILMVSCLAFFPIAQALWSYRSVPLAPRLFLAIDEALPNAFLGMVFAEGYASTAGLGFFLLVFPANGHMAEATATALITFGLMVGISCVLRLAAKNVYFANVAVVTEPANVS